MVSVRDDTLGNSGFKVFDIDLMALHSAVEAHYAQLGVDDPPPPERPW
jgi:hypothetical protein